MGIGLLRRHRAFAEPAENPSRPQEAVLEEKLRLERIRNAELEAKLAANQPAAPKEAAPSPPAAAPAEAPAAEAASSTDAEATDKRRRPR
jgi:hypothetical protein